MKGVFEKGEEKVHEEGEGKVPAEDSY